MKPLQLQNHFWVFGHFLVWLQIQFYLVVYFEIKIGKKVENSFEKITNPMWKLKQSLKFSLVHKSVRTGRPLEIDWIKNEKWKQKTPRVVIRAVVNKKIVPIYDHLSQVLDELQEIWNMFWKALDKYFEINKSSNQKIHQKSSKNGPKV